MLSLAHIFQHAKRKRAGQNTTERAGSGGRSEDKEEEDSLKSKKKRKDVKLSINPDRKDYSESKKAQLAQKAASIRLGYAFLDLLNPGNVKLVFGRYNNRPIEPARVKSLVTAFKDDGVAPWHDPIALCIPRNWVDKTSLEDHLIEGRTAPRLRFTEAAHGQVIDILGGHHRQQAFKMYMQDLQDDRAALLKRIEQVRKSRLNEDAKSEQLAELNVHLRNVENACKREAVCQVAVYAAGKCAVCSHILITLY